MESVADGESGFRAMTAHDAPLIALVDWVLPDLPGPQLCARLRSHPFAVQPYLIMISGRKEKADIVHALDAGADDFISKPFNIQETQARLRVAERAIERQQQYSAKIAELEAALKKQTDEAVTPIPIIEQASKPAVEPPVQLDALDPHQINLVITAAFLKCAISSVPHRIRVCPETEGHTVAWASLVLVKERTWLDLLLEIDPTNLALLFDETANRPAAGPGELANFCAMLHGAIVDALHTEFRATGFNALMPASAHPVRSSAKAYSLFTDDRALRHHFQAGSAVVTLVVVRQESPIHQKVIGQLRMCDVLADAYPPVDTHQIPLLHPGVVLNDHFIDKIRSFTQASAHEPPPVIVQTPSSISLHYMLETGAITNPV